MHVWGGVAGRGGGGVAGAGEVWPGRGTIHSSDLRLSGQTGLVPRTRLALRHGVICPRRIVAEAYVKSSEGLLEDQQSGSSGSTGGAGSIRVAVEDCEFFSDRPFPTGHDVITMGMVLHDWGLPKKLHLMRRCGFCPGGGRVVLVWSQGVILLRGGGILAE